MSGSARGADRAQRVVIDTDIGTDIDDAWAIALALRSPELDVQLITTVSGDPLYRARVAGGLLDDRRVPIAVGVGGGDRVRAGEPQAGLAALSSTTFVDDGVGALVDACAAPVTIIALGPLTNLAAALERDPSIAARARVVAMLGSVRVGYRGRPEPSVEYNTAVDVPAARAVLTAPWDVTITPLDTCGTILLEGDDYQRVRASKDPMVQRLLTSYREWLGESVELFDRRSTTLYDCVAVHLAHDEALYEIEELAIAVEDDGTMRIEDAATAPLVRVATRWRDQRAFIEHLVARLS